MDVILKEQRCGGGKRGFLSEKETIPQDLKWFKIKYKIRQEEYL